MKERLESGEGRLKRTARRPPAAVCSPQGHCTTCSDEVQRATVLRVDGERLMVQASLEDRTVTVDVSLVSAVQEGDVLLVHGGVALEIENGAGSSKECHG